MEQKQTDSFNFVIPKPLAKISAITVEELLNSLSPGIEFSNRFSKSIFFVNNQEFEQGTKGDQQIATACKVFIQNTIVLGYYLYLSQLVANTNDFHGGQHRDSLIGKGSIITWKYINMQEQYDFIK